MGWFIGWLLDVYIQFDHAVLWFKDYDGRSIRLTSEYSPYFHVRPRNTEDKMHLLSRLSECPIVNSVSLEQKRISLDSPDLEQLIKVEVASTNGFDRLVGQVERDRSVSSVYNADFEHVQRYLFTQLQIEPTSKVAAKHIGGRLLSIEKIDDAMEIAPPPFNMMRFRIKKDSLDGSIHWIAASTEDNEFKIEGTEKEVVSSFVNYVVSRDPDMLFCPKSSNEFMTILKRSKELDVPFDLRRFSDTEQVLGQGSIAGRIVLGDVFYGYSADQWGIAGLVERTRFAFVPPGLASRWKSNRSIDSRNCFELLKRGYAIPSENYFECARNLSELIKRDRGGLSITPEEGLFENVGVIDFDSQFPNIIMRDGLSYEGNGYEGEAFRLIPTVIAPFTNRRLWLKRLKKTLPKGSDLRRYCEQRIETLKMIAVCVAPDTKVLTKSGYQAISELESGWAECEVTSVDIDTKKLVPARVKDYIKLTSNKQDFEAYRLQSESGRSIIVTGDHPFLTPGGWKPARDIGVGERVAVYPSVENERPNQGGHEDDEALASKADLVTASSPNTYIEWALNKLRKLGLYGTCSAPASAIESAFLAIEQRSRYDYSPERIPFSKWTKTAKEGLEDGPLIWERIMRNEPFHGIKDVRDLVVEPNHSFVANGFVTHNCQYGISGCCWNRFGNAVTFEEINKKSREAMILAKRIAEKNGFRIIYGDVDSLFVSKVYATKKEYESLAAEISSETGLPSSLEKHFKFVCFVKLKDNGIAALKKYFGLTYDGEIEARGIELRRADTPEFIRDFQITLIGNVLNCKNLKDVYVLGVQRGKQLVAEAINSLRSGEVDLGKLVVVKCMRKQPSEYAVNSAHRSAALQLMTLGKEVVAGDSISYVVVDGDHSNPMCRVEADLDTTPNYDLREYSKMVVEAARTVFSALRAG